MLLQEFEYKNKQQYVDKSEDLNENQNGIEIERREEDENTEKVFSFSSDESNNSTKMFENMKLPTPLKKAFGLPEDIGNVNLDLIDKKKIERNR